MEMEQRLRADVIQRIERDYQLKHMANTNYMRKGVCPACRQKTLYTFYDSPWTLICGRPEKCDHRVYVKDVYDDLFNDWSKTAPSTADNPQATARAYLEFARGFKFELIAGLFTQDNYWDGRLNIGTGFGWTSISTTEPWEIWKAPTGMKTNCSLMNSGATKPCANPAQ